MVILSPSAKALLFHVIMVLIIVLLNIISERLLRGSNTEQLINIWTSVHRDLNFDSVLFLTSGPPWLLSFIFFCCLRPAFDWVLFLVFALKFKVWTCFSLGYEEARHWNKDHQQRHKTYKSTSHAQQHLSVVSLCQETNLCICK